MEQVFILGIAVIGGTNSVSTYSVSENDSDENLNHLKSPKNYTEYSENHDGSETLRLGIGKDYVDEAISGAKTNLEEFNKLSDKDQQLYLKYMNNPNKLFKETMEGNDPNLQFFEDNETFDDQLLIGSLAAASRSVKHTGSLRTLGITWTKYAIEGKYEYNSSKVTYCGT